MNTYAKASSSPDMALLEFIGEGVKVGNDIVDPMNWQAMQNMTTKPKDDKQQVKRKQDDGHNRDRQPRHD